MAASNEENSAENDDGVDDLTEELAQKYDADRLLKLFRARVGAAGAKPLDQAVRSRYEKRFGVDLGHVRVVTGEFAEQFNRKRNAYAVTIGATGMVLMGNSPDRSPLTAAGQALLAHELAHVAQAKRGMHFKAQTELAFAEEHERDAEAHEAAVMQEERGEAEAAAAAHDAAFGRELQKAQNRIRERVLEMLADAGHMHRVRNGVRRRG